MSQTEIPQLGGPHGSIESVHMLLRSVELSADKELASLMAVRADFDGRTVEAQQEAFIINEVTPEQFEARYTLALEQRTLRANQAAQVALFHYQTYKDQLHEQANFFNTL